MPTPEERKAERQREILEAAVRAFSRHGFHDCTVAQVAREAGVADGTIYLYFQSKDQLLVSAFRQVLERLLSRLEREISPVGDPLEKLHRLVGVHLRVMEEDPDLASFLQLQLRQPDRTIRRGIAEPLRVYAQRMEEVIDQGKAAGQIRTDVGTRVMRRVLFGAVDETVSSWLLAPVRSSLVAKLDPLLEIFVHGVANPPPSRTTDRDVAPERL